MRSRSISLEESDEMSTNASRPPFKVPPPSSSSIKPLASCNSDVSQVSSGDGASSEKKRLPPIKAPVGLAKSPDLTKCKSKIGSLDNIKHSPAGGRVKIETQKLNWSAKSKVGSLDNKDHKPAEARVKVETRKLEWKTSSKVQSLQNIGHKPGGGNVKIFDESYHKLAPAKPQTGAANHSTTATTSSSSNPGHAARAAATGSANKQAAQKSSSPSPSSARQNKVRGTMSATADRLATNLKDMNLLG